MSRFLPSAPRGGFDTPVVYFGNDWFGENRTSSHHIARRIAARVPLLYIDSPGFRAPQATARDLRKIQRKLHETFQPPQRLDVPGAKDLWHIVAPQVPFRGLPFVKTFNRWFGAYLVQRALRRIGFERYITWFASPDMAELAGHLNETFIVYYCTDDHASMPGVDGREIGALDEALTRKADQVFVTSPIMEADKKKWNPTTRYSPHGVDFSLFERALDPNLPVPEAAKNLKKPIIGFWGTVDSWVDTDLMLYCARHRPDWTFLLIGKVNEARAALSQAPNIVLPGPQPYESLPGWAKLFDVAVIPFRESRLVSHINPLKLREYLATGKPVVSTPMPEVAKLSNEVVIAREPEAFLASLQEAIDHDSEEMKMKRLHKVSTMTWDARVEDVLATVHARMEKHHG